MWRITRSRNHSTEKTPLSRFVHDASSAEKRRIYAEVIARAAAEQREVMNQADAIRRDLERKGQTA